MTDFRKELPVEVLQWNVSLKKWNDRAPKGFALEDVMEPTRQELKGNLSDLGKKVLIFGDDRSTDPWAEALSPFYGGPLPVAGRLYLSPMHFIQAKRIENAARFHPIAADFGVPDTSLDPQALEVRAAVKRMGAALRDPDARNIVRLALNVEGYMTGQDNAWNIPPTAESSGYFVTWMALWAKYLFRPDFAQRLLATRNRLLLYTFSDKTVEGVDRIWKGVNAAGQPVYDGPNRMGLELMILRKMLRLGWVRKDVNPVAIYDKICRPIFEGLLQLPPGP